MDDTGTKDSKGSRAEPELADCKKRFGEVVEGRLEATSRHTGKGEEPIRIGGHEPLQLLCGVDHRLYLLVCIGILHRCSTDPIRNRHFPLGWRSELGPSSRDQVGKQWRNQLNAPSRYLLYKHVKDKIRWSIKEVAQIKVNQNTKKWKIETHQMW